MLDQSEVSPPMHDQAQLRPGQAGTSRSSVYIRARALLQKTFIGVGRMAFSGAARATRPCLPQLEIKFYRGG